MPFAFFVIALVFLVFKADHPFAEELIVENQTSINIKTPCVEKPNSVSFHFSQKDFDALYRANVNSNHSGIHNVPGTILVLDKDDRCLFQLTAHENNSLKPIQIAFEEAVAFFQALGATNQSIFKVYSDLNCGTFYEEDEAYSRLMPNFVPPVKLCAQKFHNSRWAFFVQNELDEIFLVFVADQLISVLDKRQESEVN